MATVKRFDPTTGAAPRIQTGAQSQMLGSLADRLKGFAERENKLADIQAQTEGELAGQAAAAGRVGGVDIPEDMTIRDQAFAKGARTAHLAAIQTDIRQTVADLETNNQYDIESFNEQIDGYRSGLLQEVDDQLKPMVIDELGSYSVRSKVRIESNIFKQGQTEQLAAINTAADGMKQDVLTSAYLGDEDMLVRKQSQYYALLDEGVADNLLDKDKVETLKRDFEDEVDVQNVMGVFDRTIEEEGLDAAQKSFESFRSRKAHKSDIDVREKIMTKMRSALSHERAKLRSEQTRKNAEIKAREKALNKTVKNAEFSLDHGYQVDGLPDLIEVSRGTKHEATLREIQIHQDAVNEFVQMSPASMDQYLKDTVGKKLNGDQVRIVERLKNVRDHTRSELKAGRGMDLALKQGIIDDLPSLDSPDGLQQRAELASVASEHYGVPISPMTDTEIDDFKTRLDESSTDDKIVAMGQVVDGLGENAMPVLENLAGKNSGMYAVAGSLMADGQGLLGREMIKGLDAREAYPKVIPTDFDAKFNSVIKSAYVRTPKQVATLRDGMRSLYAQRAVTVGDYQGATTDTDLLEQSFNEVTGGVYTLQDQGTGFFMDDRYDIEAPEPGVDQDAFIDWMENITQADVEAMGATTIAPELTKAINDMSVKLVTLGDGKYQVLRNGLPVVNEDLTPFILSWPK